MRRKKSSIGLGITDSIHVQIPDGRTSFIFAFTLLFSLLEPKLHHCSFSQFVALSLWRCCHSVHHHYGFSGLAATTRVPLFSQGPLGQVIYSNNDKHCSHKQWSSYLALILSYHPSLSSCVSLCHLSLAVLLFLISLSCCPSLSYLSLLLSFSFLSLSLALFHPCVSCSVFFTSLLLPFSF